MIKKLKENKYLRNASYLISDNILKLILAFFTSALIARCFGPENLGKLNYVNSIIGILQIFIMLGFDIIVLRDISFNEKRENIIIGTACVLRIIATVIIYFIGYLVFKYLIRDGDLIKYYLIIGISMFILPFAFIKQWFQKRCLNKFIVASSQIILWSTTIIKVFIVIYKYKFDIYIYVVSLTTVVEILVLIYFYNKNGGKILNWKFSMMYAKKLLKNSFPILMQGFAIYMYMKVDQVMIGKMLGTTKLGVYSVGTTLAELIYFIPLSLASSYYPKFVEAKTQSESIYEETLLKLSSLSIFICFLFSIGATIFGSYFINLVYGLKYEEAGSIFKIYSWASVFVALGVSHSNYIILEKKQMYALKATLWGAIFNVIFNVIFIKKYGNIGAAYATVISQFIATYGYYIFLKEKKYFKLRTKSFNILLFFSKIKKNSI